MRQKPDRRLDEIEAELRRFDNEFDVNLSGELTPAEKLELDRWARSWFAFTSHVHAQPFAAFGLWRQTAPAMLAFCAACTDDELFALDRFGLPPDFGVELSFLHNLMISGQISQAETEVRIEELKARFLPDVLEKLKQIKPAIADAV